MSIKTIYSAVSDYSGHLWMRRCNPGNETCSIIVTAVPENEIQRKSIQELEATFDSVPVTTIDILLHQLQANGSLPSTRTGRANKQLNSKTNRTRRLASKRPVVDILLIDTEGYDAKVLTGARGSLQRGLIRMVVFEYHVEYPWTLTSLRHVVEMLSTFSYDCYYEGQRRLWKLTGETNTIL